jgi:hypothetical protein
VGGAAAHYRSPGIAPCAAPRVPSEVAQMMGGSVPAGAWLIAWFAAVRHLWGEARMKSGAEVRVKPLG